MTQQIVNATDHNVTWKYSEYILSVSRTGRPPLVYITGTALITSETHCTPCERPSEDVFSHENMIAFAQNFFTE